MLGEATATGDKEIKRSGVFQRSHLASLSRVAVAELLRCRCSACSSRQLAAIRGDNDRRRFYGRRTLNLFIS
jgi:hypothetical protein